MSVTQWNFTAWEDVPDQTRSASYTDTLSSNCVHCVLY